MRLLPLVTGILLGLGLSDAGRAQVVVSFPLEGHYRPGRYMPVRIKGNGGKREQIELRAGGAVPTQARLASNADVVVPWLAISELREPRWSSPGEQDVPLQPALRPLGDGERLVAFTGPEDPTLAAALFPGKRLIAVALEPSRPLLEPAIAWETLDAIVVPPAVFERLADRCQLLLAAGMAIVVRSESQAPPDARWPWTRLGDYWVLRHESIGPGEVIVPAAYSPTYAWERAWPPAFRWKLGAFALVLCILATAASLWRSRMALLALFIVSGGAALVLTLWYSHQSAVLELRAGVIVRDKQFAQFDLWRWQSSVRPADTSVEVSGLVHPVFATARQAEQMQFKLLAAPDGSMRFAYYLEPQQTAALMTRTLRSDWLPGALQPVMPALQTFAQDLYVQPPARLLGQFSARTSQTSNSTPIAVIDQS